MRRTSSSSEATNNGDEEVLCYCGKRAKMRTSWTKDNPGRRFYNCSIGRGNCAFFAWEDPPICARSKLIIPGLLRKINALEDKVVNLQKKTHCSSLFVSSFLVNDFVYVV
ncbi:UNVERIFIED_CONTAM: hypothetical protein Sradi_3719900 [Sesamum radiatum]|uniref:GRF-type domain-containing protein n=1 Tax=Sesamum radiatum TaxID=300843 RepID=A0AAW2PXQ4_SESRA